MAKVPLAAKVLDIRESQKLRIIENLKLERQRVRLEADIGKAPPLSDDGLSEHLREEAYVTYAIYHVEHFHQFVASFLSIFDPSLLVNFRFSEPCGLGFDPKVDDLSTPLPVPFLCK